VIVQCFNVEPPANRARHGVARARPHRAFTLIESIAAIVILAIAIPPMLWSIKQAHVQRVNPMMASKARWLATEKLEDIIADRHSTTRGYAFVAGGNYPTENPVAGSPGFRRSVSINETGADLTTPGLGYKRATVTVTWTDATGASRSLSVATVVTDY
jgi:prepilin-type N-terminal cleavage/methylation domain-containing protein